MTNFIVCKLLDKKKETNTHSSLSVFENKNGSFNSKKESMISVVRILTKKILIGQIQKENIFNHNDKRGI